MFSKLAGYEACGKWVTDPYDPSRGNVRRFVATVASDASDHASPEAVDARSPPGAPAATAGSPGSPGKRSRSPATAQPSLAAAKWLKKCKGKRDYERKHATRLARKNI